MIITAKFASTCPCCGKSIAVGSRVHWSKGAKASHVACGATSTAGVQSWRNYTPRRPQQREDCRKYGWDGIVGSASYYSSGQYDEDS